jgi:hypothetical protein
MDQELAQQAILTAAARVEEWKNKFMEDWYGPMMKNSMKMYWQSLTPEMKDQLRKQDPQAFDQVDTFLNGQ